MSSRGVTGRAAWMLVLLLASPFVVAAEKAWPVRAASLESLAIYPLVSAPAQVLSLNDSRIASEVSSVVDEIPVRVGDTVEVGGELVILACDDQRSILAQAMAGRDALKARLDFANFQYARAKKLVASKNISDEQLRQRKADAGALKAELAGAEAGVARGLRDVGRCRITAPFKAVVIERLIGVGEQADPGKPVVRLMDLSALEVSAQVQAFDADSLKQTTSLELVVEDERYPVKLRNEVPALDPRSRSRELRLEFIQAMAQPGSSGRLEWRRSTPHLPAEYLLRRNGKYGIFTMQNEQVKFVEVPGAREGSPVSPDLPHDTLIVTEGRYGLNDGDVVSLVE